MNVLYGNNVNAARARLNAGGMNINSLRFYGYTPLAWAAIEGRPEMVRLFINRGAKLNTTFSGLSLTALMYASIKGHFEIVRMLVEAGARVNLRTIDDNSALSYAVTHNHPRIARYLVQHGADLRNLPARMNNNLRNNLYKYSFMRGRSLPRSLMNRETGRRNNSRRFT
jgi:ankyrin repeat protein